MLGSCLEMVTWHMASLPLVHEVVRLAICEACPADIWAESLAQEVEEGQGGGLANIDYRYEAVWSAGSTDFLKRHARPGELDKVVTRSAGLACHWSLKDIKVIRGCSPFSPCELIRSWSLGKGALTLASSVALCEGVVGCGDWSPSWAPESEAAVATGDAWKWIWLGRPAPAPAAAVSRLGSVVLGTSLLPGRLPAGLPLTPELAETRLDRFRRRRRSISEYMQAEARPRLTQAEQGRAELQRIFDDLQAEQACPCVMAEQPGCQS